MSDDGKSLSRPHTRWLQPPLRKPLRRHKVELAPCAPRSCWESGPGCQVSSTAAGPCHAMGRPNHARVGGAWTTASPRAFPRGVPPSLGFPGGKAEKAAGEGRLPTASVLRDLRARGRRAWWRPFSALGARPRARFYTPEPLILQIRKLRPRAAGRRRRPGRPRPASNRRREQQRLAPQAVDTAKPPGGAPPGPRPKSPWLLLAPQKRRAALLTRACPR